MLSGRPSSAVPNMKYRTGHVLLLLMILLVAAELVLTIRDPWGEGIDGTPFLVPCVLSFVGTGIVMVVLGFVCVTTDPTISPETRRRWIIAMIMFMPTASLVFFAIDWIRRP